MELAISLVLLSPWHIALIVVAILLLFGGKKIPELMRGIGSGIKEFKKGVKDDDESSKDQSSKDAPKKSHKKIED